MSSTSRGTGAETQPVRHKLTTNKAAFIGCLDWGAWADDDTPFCFVRDGREKEDRDQTTFDDDADAVAQ